MEKETKTETTNGNEEVPLAIAPEETVVEPEVIVERETRKRYEGPTKEELLEKWVPKTKIGRLVKNKEIKNIDEVLDRYRVLEPEIVDSLLNLKNDLLQIGQMRGKFGGGKRAPRKQTQKKTAEGNVTTFSIMAIVGDENGRVGIGRGRAKETVPAKEKAIRKAKLNIMKITRGCGSFDCSCGEPHSVPVKVKGKCGSAEVVLMPAPQGTGLVAADELKKILKLVGIKDVYSQTFGKTKTTSNLAKACLDALKKTNKIKY